MCFIVSCTFILTYDVTRHGSTCILEVSFFEVFPTILRFKMRVNFPLVATSSEFGPCPSDLLNNISSGGHGNKLPGDEDLVVSQLLFFTFFLALFGVVQNQVANQHNEYFQLNRPNDCSHSLKV